MKEHEDIQMVACDSVESIVCLDFKEIEQANLFVAFINNNKSICNGIYGEEHFSVGNEELDNDPQFLRVFTDLRKPGSVKFHVNCQGENYRLTSDSSDEAQLIIFIETPKFCQLSLYNGFLIRDKISHIFLTSDKMKGPIRTLAYSILTHNFKHFPQGLRQMESRQK